MRTSQESTHQKLFEYWILDLGPPIYWSLTPIYRSPTPIYRSLLNEESSCSWLSKAVWSFLFHYCFKFRLSHWNHTHVQNSDSDYQVPEFPVLLESKWETDKYVLVILDSDKLLTGSPTTLFQFITQKWWFLKMHNAQGFLKWGVHHLGIFPT